MRIGLGMSIVGGGYAPSGITYLSDVGGTPTAAYSVRKVVNGYSGSAIRVRESSGHTETDIGFVGQNLDEAALLAHCGANDGFVTKWYDQSGSGYDAVQATAGSQPKIVSAGTVIKENGLPALDFDGTVSLATASPVALANQSIFAAVKLDTTITTASTVQTFWRNDAATADSFGFGGVTGTLTNERLAWLIVSGGTVYGFGETSADITSGDYLFSALFNTSPSTSIYQNSSLLSLTATSGGFGGGAFTDSIYPSGFQRIANNSAGTAGFDGKFWELIIYASDKSSLRTDIEGNINGYYSIYI